VTATGRDPMLVRLERDSLAVAAAMTVLAAVLWPGQPQRALGVLGGFALMAVSYRGIRAGVEGLWAGPPPGAADPGGGPAPPGRGPRSGFVKFFTRHAILAGGAYVMMARFEFDPMAMLAGVTAPAVAATLELVRTFRARQGGPHSRSS
jgi:hypothetical protein